MPELPEPRRPIPLKMASGFILLICIPFGVSVIANIATDPIRDHVGAPWGGIASFLGSAGLRQFVPSLWAILVVLALYWWSRGAAAPIAAPEVTPSGAPDALAPVPRLEITIEPPIKRRYGRVDKRHDDGDFIHVLVTNHGEAETFVAQVVDFKGITEGQIQYFAKWRDHNGEERRIYKNAIIELGKVTLPHDKTERARWTQSTAALLGAANIAVPPPSDDGSDAEWESGRLRLFSQSNPDGWDVYGTTPAKHRALLQVKKPDPLSVFDVLIGLKLRVTAASGTCIERWIYTSFNRPEWHYGSQFWMLGGANVEITEDEKAVNRRTL